MKRFRRGAHRSRPPAETLARIGPIARALGVTRLGDVTGLDRIGIPVFQAIRPLSRSLSVSQGKGATPDAARVSALMEAIELHHAEIAVADTYGPAGEGEAALWSGMSQADGQSLPFDPARSRGWIDAIDLLSGRAIRVPHGLVTLDFAEPLEPDLWPNTNGLASGNNRAEAQVASLCEAIERDAHARWLEGSSRERSASALDPATIDDRLGRLLISRISAAALNCSLWDMTGPQGVAVIGCAIVERGSSEAMLLPPAFGAGCHPDATVALARAICEAAQTRAGLIAGSRDDIDPAAYRDAGAKRLGLMMSTLDFAGGGTRRWSAVPSVVYSDADADLAWLLERCAAIGCPAIVCVDLTRAEIGVDVVKLIVPGFGDHDRPARRITASRTLVPA
jgi:ribosomal protein S12 methylthiotransferase accessory factor